MDQVEGEDEEDHQDHPRQEAHHLGPRLEAVAAVVVLLPVDRGIQAQQGKPYRSTRG